MSQSEAVLPVPRGVPTSEGWMQYLIQGHRFEIPTHFSVSKVVGYGAYGTVCAATDTRVASSTSPQASSSSSVAIKKISRLFDNAVDCKRILRELKILSFVHHTNLLHLREFVPIVQKETYDEVYVVTDLYDTDLGRIIRSKQQLTEEHFQYFVVQTLRGLNYLHSANILHRDLKPTNILINANCDIAIADFGLARGESAGDLTEYVITRWYRPPELLSLATKYTTAVDIWSAGLIFAELLGGKALLPGKDYVMQLSLVVELLGTPSEDDMECLSEQAKTFVRLLPRKAPQDFQRIFPNASVDAIDLLRALLQFHPKKRPKAHELFNHPYLAKFRDPNEEAAAPRPFEFEVPEDPTIPELRELIYAEIMSRSDPMPESAES